MSSCLAGDLLGHYCPRWGGSCAEMSTAIVRIHTPEGFVIAADGREMILKDCVLARKTDEAQKIFPIARKDLTCAYSFAGNCVFGQSDDDPTKAAFDFDLEAQHAIGLLSIYTPSTLYDYAKRLCLEMNMRLSQEIGKLPSDRADAEHPAEKDTVARMLFDGYCNGIPQRVNVRFWLSNGSLEEPEISPGDILTSEPYVYGSSEIHHLLFNTQDERFSSYRRPALRAQDITMAEAVQIANSYIGACSDPIALEIDAKTCRAIGGHIHIAKVTKEQGFEWIIPPKV